jgi:hypothetical protein
MGQHATPRLHIAGPLLTLEQAAAMLGVTGSTLRQRARAGHLLSFRRGRKLFTTRKWLEQYRAERHRKPGRPRAEQSLEDRYIESVAQLMGLDLPASFEELDDLLFAAARLLIAEVPFPFRRKAVDQDEVRDVISRYRSVLVDGEPEPHRQAAVEAIVARVFADPLVQDIQFSAMRDDAREHPSALGQRWKDRFWEKLGALTVDPRIPGTISRLDVAVAAELAAEQRRAQPDLADAELIGLLERAMLEGSQNLPHTYGASKEYMSGTIQEALTASALSPGAVGGHLTG